MHKVRSVASWAGAVALPSLGGRSSWCEKGECVLLRGHRGVKKGDAKVVCRTRGAATHEAQIATHHRQRAYLRLDLSAELVEDLAEQPAPVAPGWP